jgi:thiol-disulfide isomerase/thioredoxin
MAKKLIILHSLTCPYSQKALPIARKVAQEKNIQLTEYVMDNHLIQPIPEKYFNNNYPIFFIEDSDKIIELKGYTSENNKQEELYKDFIDNFEEKYNEINKIN